ncbi:MAG TPA: HAD family hydrolase [Clostridia bacterium]|nr:HAD family hydrolase [Clostridia bacterium]
MTYRAVLFDFDFTLADSSKGIIESFAYAFDKLGIPVPASDDIRKTIGLSLTESLKRLTGITDQEVYERFHTYFKEKADTVMTRETVLYPDTVRVLGLLKGKGLKTGIVTTKYGYRIREVIDKFGMHGLIDIIIGGDAVTEMKPSPQGLNLAADRLNTDKRSILYVGDSVVDAQAAMAARIDFAAVTTGFAPADMFNKYPHKFIVRSLAELAAVLAIV